MCLFGGGSVVGGSVSGTGEGLEEISEVVGNVT